MSLPKGFHYVHFGDAFTPMSDGFLTPPCHDGTTVFPEGKGIVRMIRNQEGYGQGKTRGGKFHAYDRVARGGVTSSLFDTDKGKLIESGIVLNGTHENCNGGPTPWGSWLSCEENTEGPTQGFEKPHGYVFEVPRSANRAVEPVPIKAMGRMEHEAAAVDPRSGIVYLTEDNGDPADGFYRFLPNDTRRLHRGGVLQMLAVEGHSRFDTTHDQRVGVSLHCEWVTIDDPDPEEAETEPAAVWRQGRAKGAAQFIGGRGVPLGEGQRLLRRLRRRQRRRGPGVAIHPARPQARHAGPPLRVEERKGARRTRHDHGLAARRRADLRGRRRRGRSGRR
jgi:hypothetical protein